MSILSAHQLTADRSEERERVHFTFHVPLLQVTVVGVDGRLVYESLVCPENDIIDFNTRYSGISAKDFGNTPPFHDQNHRSEAKTFDNQADCC